MFYKTNISKSLARLSTPKKVYLTVGIIALLGAAIRWSGLKQISLMMDSVWIYFMLQKGVSGWQMMTNWLHVGGAPSTLPFAVATTAFINQTFHVAPSIVSTIFPATLWGIATIPTAYAAGKQWGGQRLGLILCAMVAFNPILIQLSREAYFYAPMLCGAFLSLWSIGISTQLYRKDATIPWYFHIINALAIFIMAYATPSSWTYTAAIGATHGGFMLYHLIRYKKGAAHLFILAITFMVIGTPLLLADWGLSNILEFTKGPTKEYWEKVFRGIKSRNLSQLMFIWRQCLWGTTPLRTAVSLLIAITGIFAIIPATKRDRRFAVPAIILIVILIGNLLALKKSVWGIGLRYLAVLIPIYFLIITNGILWLTDKINRRLKNNHIAEAACLIPLALLWLQPIYLATHMTGQPTPYMAITNFLDKTLPKNSPVLTDRFFTAYNEYRAHAPTNVIFMSVAPNQIHEQYLGNHFRQRAEDFIRNNPVSAIHEEKHLWNDPEVGPWTWPSKFYAHEKSFIDESSVKLSEIGQALRTNPHARTIRYNLPEDVLEKARKNGSKLQAFYSTGWNVTQTRDYHFWHVLQQSAEIEIHNLTAQPLKTMIKVTCVAPGRKKTILFGRTKPATAPANKFVTITFGPVEIAPGKNKIRMQSPDRQVPLLVDSIQALPANK